MRYERIKVKRDDYTTYNKPVFPWEVPVLEYMFGEGNVERLNEFETSDAPYPDAREEFFRLEKAYGSDPDTHISFACSVYGQAATGINALRRAITEAKAAEHTTKSKRRRAKLEFSADPLMA